MARFYWRAWLGPRYTKASDARHFDWSGLTSGSTMARAPEAALNADFLAAHLSLALVSGAGWPVKGGAWVGPNGAGQGWEYVEYSGLSNGVMTGMVRELSSVREHNGNHSAGAVVRQWWPIEGDDGKIHLTRRMADRDEFEASSWEIELSGVNVPRFALKNTHICVIESRVSYADAWTIFAVGWVLGPEYSDTAEMLGEWRVKVASLAGVLQQARVAGVRVGAVDASRTGSAIGRKEIPYPFKERHSGDYVAGEPTFEPKNVIDGDPQTLWIAEKFHGTRHEAEYKTVNTDHFNQSCFPSMVYLHNPPGYVGLRYVEWFIGGSLLDGWMVNKNGAEVFASMPSDGELGDRRVFCEDKSRFLAAHPEIDESSVKEIGSAWFDALDTADDAIGYYVPLVQYWSNTLAWGSGGAVRPKYHDNEWGWKNGRGWDGPKLAAPGVGQVLRYWYKASAANPVDHFLIDYVDNVKYEIGQGSNSYVLVRLPGLGLGLRDDVTAGAPAAGSTLYIVDGGGPSTAGLPASGTVQVGDEQITFSAKGSEGITVSARGANGTAAAAHLAGDLVKVLDGGVATDGLPLKSIGWRRSGGTIYPKDFKVRRSGRDEVQEPFRGTTGTWEWDFETVADVTGYAASFYDVALSPARRCRYVMVEIAKMTTDPARPRLNEIVCSVDPAFYDAALWLTTNTEAWLVLKQILLNGGVPAACITTSGLSSLPLASAMTAADACWRVAADFAGVCGLRLHVDLDSHVRIVPEPVFLGLMGEPLRTWTRADAARVEVMLAGDACSQVELIWQKADGSDGGVVAYPSAAHWRGSPVELGPFYYDSAVTAQAAADVRYHMRRFPYVYLVLAADGDLTVRPGDYHAVTWQFGLPGSEAAWTRRGQVAAVDHVLEDGVWQTLVTLRSVAKETFDL